MRQILPLLIAVLALSLSSCEKDSCEQTWTQLVSVPVTVARAAVQDSIVAMPARELCTGGNLYAFGDYVFVNANREGYHLLDNRDPANPINVGFLRVPGATHMAFVEGRMVSDSYADMLVLDFGGPNSLRLISSTPNLLLSTEGFLVENDRVVVGFEMRDVEFTQSCSGSTRRTCNTCSEVDVAFDNNSNSNRNNSGSIGGGNPQINTGGSLARLSFCDTRLYVLAPNRLTTFELQNDKLVEQRQTSLTGGQETIARQGDFLYVASQWGLTIFEIKDCGLPLQVGSAPRFWSNDPVAIEGDRAVVTLRSGDIPREGMPGSMIIYDVANPRRPTELVRHPLPHPVGVALYDGILYICDATLGILVYDFRGGSAETLLTRSLQTIGNADAVDLAVLPYQAGTVMLTIGNRSVRQYTRASNGTLSAVSILEAVRCNAQ